MARHSGVLQRTGIIESDDIQDALDGKSTPIDVFRKAGRFMGGVDPLAIALRSGNDEYVKEFDALASEIIRTWKTERLPDTISNLPRDDVEVLAALAAKAAFAFLRDQARVIPDGRIIDEVTGLVLPPEPRRPYRERGHHPDGSRLSVFEHFQREYGPYLEAHLLFSGHLQDIDRPGYEALLYVARKDARVKGLEDDVSNTAAFLLDHGILAGEHLEFPPKHLTRQVDIINMSRAVSNARKFRGRRGSKANSDDHER
jgi:hypothetical protein